MAPPTYTTEARVGLRGPCNARATPMRSPKTLPYKSAKTFFPPNALRFQVIVSTTLASQRLAERECARGVPPQARVSSPRRSDRFLITAKKPPDLKAGDLRLFEEAAERAGPRGLGIFFPTTNLVRVFRFNQVTKTSTQTKQRKRTKQQQRTRSTGTVQVQDVLVISKWRTLVENPEMLQF